MLRSSSNLVFAVVLLLSFALLIWWTLFLLDASAELSVAGERLAAGDLEGVARALGAGDGDELVALGHRRRWMFVSEGAFFILVLLVCGGLYLASVRRERRLQLNQDRFLAAATHELKTPLATISLLLESLHAGRVPAEKRDRYLADGLLEAERLERGLHNLLIAAGLRSTGTIVHTEAGDLVADVRAALAALQARADAADVRVTLHGEATLPARRDAAAWQLVVRNLLDNAIKFSPAGATVEVHVQRRDDHAELVVKDHGRGLDADERTHAFEPFWRGDDQATGGTGLGLHLVQEMVRAHGGSVSARSDGRDRGAEFTVRLPLEGAR
ncbi:MAG TPA: HAMP domain-containing histidine kinase [bacterium]|nr:HAMP domain-containing histidine kinase [bacterium]